MYGNIGKKVGTNLYIHEEYLQELPQNYLEFFKTAFKSFDKSVEFNVLKLDLKNQKISYLYYPGFFEEPFPILKHSLFYDVESGRTNFKSFENSANPPILHRKELLICSSHPEYEAYRALTLQAEGYGLFEEMKKIGFKNYWDDLLKQKSLRFDRDSYTFVKKHTVDRYKSALTRYELSLPVRLLLKHKMLKSEYRFFDYGCGKGSDVELLIQEGFKRIDSFDPHFFPNNGKKKADVINLGYVINVIEEAEPFNDGYLTNSNTFQKYYTQQEIKSSFMDRPLTLAIKSTIRFSFKSV